MWVGPSLPVHRHSAFLFEGRGHLGVASTWPDYRSHCTSAMVCMEQYHNPGAGSEAENGTHRNNAPKGADLFLLSGAHISVQSTCTMPTRSALTVMEHVYQLGGWGHSGDSRPSAGCVQSTVSWALARGKRTVGSAGLQL